MTINWEQVDVEILSINISEQIKIIPTESSIGSSLFQLFQEYLTLDGGCASSGWKETPALNGGGVEA